MKRPSKELCRGVAMVLHCVPEAALLHLSADEGAYLADDLIGFRVWPDGLAAARLPDGSFVRFDAYTEKNSRKRRTARRSSRT